MKTLLAVLLLTCTLPVAGDCDERQKLRMQLRGDGVARGAECDDPPRLRTQFLTDYEGGAVWLWIWGPTVCTNWTFEVSEDLRTWRPFRGYWGDMHYVCTNNARPNECLRYAMERTIDRHAFYRLRKL